jgi:hypothetical protein
MDMKVAVRKFPVHFTGRKQFRELTLSDWIIAGTAFFIIGNALSICIGWWIRTPALVQLLADDAPTHFNTALGFILLGVAT